MIEPSQPSGPPAQRSSLLGGPIGLVAVILAGLAWAAVLSRPVVLRTLMMAESYPLVTGTYATVTAVSTGMVLVLALAGLACGIVSLVRGRPRRSLIVVATTISALLLVDIAFHGVLDPLTQLIRERF